MKACRFILNTDYVTSQNDNEIEISVSLPSSFTTSASQVRHFTANKTLAGSASKDFRVYFTSSTQPYAATGCYWSYLRYGSDDLIMTVKRTKDKFTLDVYNLALTSSHTYSGAARVITAHIQTFVDPFQL